MKIIVCVQPNAKNTEITGFDGNILKLKIKAPPLENKANEELIKFLAKTLKISKSAIKILYGHHSKTKTIEIQTTNNNLSDVFLNILSKKNNK